MDYFQALGKNVEVLCSLRIELQMLIRPTVSQFRSAYLLLMNDNVDFFSTVVCIAVVID